MRPRIIGKSRDEVRVVGGTTSLRRFRAAKSRARLTGRDVLRVDLDGIVSKYLGETERNIRRLFDEAERTNASLYFEEADALFGEDVDADTAKKTRRAKRTIVSLARRRGVQILTGKAASPSRTPSVPTPESDDVGAIED